MAATMLSELYQGVLDPSKTTTPSATASPAVTSAIVNPLSFLDDFLPPTNTTPFPSATMPGNGLGSNFTDEMETNEDPCTSMIAIYCSAPSDAAAFAFLLIFCLAVGLLLLAVVAKCVQARRKQQTREASEEEIELESRGFSKAEQKRLQQEKKQTEKRIEELEREKAIASASQA